MSNKVPTLEQLTEYVKNLIIQRAGLKDQLEQLDKQLPVFQGQLNLLQAQAEAAKEQVELD